MGKPYKKQPPAQGQSNVVYRKETMTPYEYGKWYENASGAVKPTASPIDYALMLQKALTTTAGKTIFNFMTENLPEKIAAPFIIGGVAASTINDNDKKRQLESMHWEEPAGSKTVNNSYPLRVYRKKPFISF